MTTGTPIKRRTQTDPEIKAIQKVLAIVGDLPVSPRRRVLEYALSRVATLEFDQPRTYSFKNEQPFPSTSVSVSSNRPTPTRD